MKPKGVEKLKDVINVHILTNLSGRIQLSYPLFNSDSFITNISARGISEKTFFERIILGAQCLHSLLPEDFETACSILLSAAPAPITTEGYGTENYDVLILTRFISLYGLEYPDVSLPGLAKLTQSYTAEFDIRPFIESYPKRTFDFLKDLATSQNFHERRLASEGCRPRLPLASHLGFLKNDPQPCIEILTLLRKDPIRYVQKSVANNLSDILKDNPKIGYKTLSEWVAESHPATNWIIKRAIRKPLQDKDPAALSLLAQFSSEELHYQDG